MVYSLGLYIGLFNAFIENVVIEKPQLLSWKLFPECKIQIYLLSKTKKKNSKRN